MELRKICDGARASYSSTGDTNMNDNGTNNSNSNDNSGNDTCNFNYSFVYDENKYCNRRTYCLREAFGKSSDRKVLVRALPMAPSVKTETDNGLAPTAIKCWPNRQNRVASV